MYNLYSRLVKANANSMPFCLSFKAVSCGRFFFNSEDGLHKILANIHINQIYAQRQKFNLLVADSQNLWLIFGKTPFDG